MSAPTAQPSDEEVIDATAAPPTQPRWREILTGSSTSILLVLIAMIVVFSALRFEQFFSVSNARNIATDAAVLLVVATGLTYVIITAGIDLSVGSVLVFSSVVSARMMNAVGGDNWGVIIVGALTALAAGLGWGTLNGFLVTKAKIPSFIVTLGTLGMALGGALLITGGVDERNVPFKLVETIGTGRLFGEIPYLIVIAAVVALIFGVILAMTRFGRYTYAIGSNEEGVRRAGVNVDLHLIKVYALTGMLAGFAGFLALARFGTTSIAGNTTVNLDSIAAIVIGGTSLFGGIGTILGTVIGVFIPAVLRNGFVIVGVQPFWQQVAVGAVLIAAVYVDQLRRSRYAR
jgi:ribose transport system permease protein